MICLNNTDTLEGGASVNAVVDFSVHGLVGTTFTNIAQGQLSNTNPSVLYTAGAAISIVSVIFVNTHSAAVTVDLYLDPANAGTPRRLIPKTLTLGIGYSMHFDGQRLSILDANGAIITGVNVSDTAFAASWDGVTTIAPSKNAVWDGLGTGASPTHVGMTLSGATASLPLFTGASKELVSKSVADTQTALGLAITAGKTITCTQNTSLDEVVAMSSKLTLALGAANLKAFMNAAGNAAEFAAGIKIGTLIYDTATVDGTQNSGSIGFKPSVVLLFVGIDGTSQMSVGFDDGTSHYCLADAHAATANAYSMQVAKSITLFQSSSIYCQGYISTMGADVFTITWAKTGAKTGLANIFYMPFR